MKFNFSKINPHPEYWEEANLTASNPLNTTAKYPKNEIGYIRADFDYQWWNTCFPIIENAIPELEKEFDELFSLLISECPTLDALAEYCKENAEQLEGNEYNLFTEGEYGFYWIRAVIRQKDYNLYVHCLEK